MKILQVLSTLCTGGAEHCAVELTNELNAQGYECDLVTLFDVEKGNDLKSQISDKAKVFSLHKKLGLDIRCYFRLYNCIRKGNYDVVHAHVGAIPYLLLSTLLCRKVKFISTIHSEAKREAGKSISKWNRFFMFRHGLCTPVTISEESKSSFDEYYKMNAPMVYNGVSDYERSESLHLRDNEDQLIFIHPASCQIVKNQQLLFKAFSKLSSEFSNIKLLWLGNNKNYYDVYESLLQFMPKTVNYIGVVPNVRDYLAEADAMCLSSRMEGMPMTIIEAFSVGCPSLCTPVGGIVNMIKDGENGMLSTNIEVESYYKMLKTFCELTPEQRKQMRDNAKLSFSKYSIANSVKGYLEIYKS
jgi:glycosyltransferase involved in cell wall biosynthesis